MICRAREAGFDEHVCRSPRGRGGDGRREESTAQRGERLRGSLSRPVPPVVRGADCAAREVDESPGYRQRAEAAVEDSLEGVSSGAMLSRPSTCSRWGASASPRRTSLEHHREQLGHGEQVAIRSLAVLSGSRQHDLLSDAEIARQPRHRDPRDPRRRLL